MLVGAFLLIVGSNLVSSVVAHHILYVFLFGHGNVSGIKIWSL
jgi:hypothetical protein